MSDLWHLRIETKARPGRAGVRRAAESHSNTPVHKRPGMSSSVRRAFEEALHPRGPGGRFATKPHSERVSRQRSGAPRQLVGQERLKSSGVSGDDEIVVRSKRVRKYRGHGTVEGFVASHPRGRAHALRVLAADHKAGRIGFKAAEKAPSGPKAEAPTTGRGVTIDPKLADGSFRANTVPVSDGVQSGDFVIALGRSQKYPTGITVEQFLAAHPKGLKEAARVLTADHKAGRITFERYKTAAPPRAAASIATKPAAASSTGGDHFDFGAATSEKFRQRMKSGYESISPGVRAKLEAFGVKIKGPGKVSDADPDLAIQRGRGHKEGTTLENGGGYYKPWTKEIVVPEKSLYRQTGKYHDMAGQDSTVVHEAGHAFDQMNGNISAQDGFRRAYHADLVAFDRKGGNRNDERFSYYMQSGEAGTSEMFAEQFAEHHGHSSGLIRSNLKEHFPRSAQYVANLVRQHS